MAAFLVCALVASAHATPNAPERARAVAQVLRDVCDKEVVLLGENAHGDGLTIAIKVDLVTALIDRCRFQTVLFEANYYDFMALSRAGQSASPKAIAAAIGGTWNRTAEIQPLVSFLADRSAAGKVRLGGLDDQLGHFGALYANDAMPDELTAVLASERRNDCRERLRREIYSDYAAAAPRTAETQSALLSCLADMRGAKTSDGASAAAYRDQINAAVTRAVTRASLKGVDYVADRDAAMYLLFAQHRERSRPRAKIIVWSANSHVTRDGRAFGGATPDQSLGGRVSTVLGRRAFSLGFSAAGGAYRWSREATKPVPEASAGSLEHQALGGSATAYVNHSKLKKYGPIAGSMSGHKAGAYDWAKAFDGILLLGREEPTTIVVR